MTYYQNMSPEQALAAADQLHAGLRQAAAGDPDAAAAVLSTLSGRPDVKVVAWDALLDTLPPAQITQMFTGKPLP